MKHIKKFRFSSTGRILNCPPSRWGPDVDIEHNNDFANIGHAIHDFLYKCVAFGYSDTRFLKDSAEKFDVEANDDLYRLAWCGIDCVKFILEHGEAIYAEEILEFDVLDWEGTGHPDLICKSFHKNGQLMVIDWKTGTPKQIHWDQLRMYGIAAVKRFKPKNRDIKLITCYLREPSDTMIQIEDFSEQEQSEFLVDLENALDPTSETYGPNPEGCQYCPHRGNCVARDVELESVSSWVVAGAAEKATLQVMVDHIDKVKEIKSECEKYLSSLKARLEDSPIRSQDGHLYSIVEQHRDKIKAKEALTWIMKACDEKGIDYHEAFELATKDSVSKTNLRPLAKLLKMTMPELLDNIKDSNGIETNIIKTIKKEKQ
jgi:hypothetical protein